MTNRCVDPCLTKYRWPNKKQQYYSKRPRMNRTKAIPPPFKDDYIDNPIVVQEERFQPVYPSPPSQEIGSNHIFFIC